RLFRVGDDEHVLVAVVHHIAADGWSITPLVADLGVAYASRCAGQAPGWADLPVQYVDYTLWQRAQQVARVAREHNATSFMVVQAALAVLLAKVSASSDVAVGFPIAG